MHIAPLLFVFAIMAPGIAPVSRAVTLESGDELPSPAEVDAINEFSASLYREVASDEKNLIVSPFSVRTAMAMVAAGADTTTEAELVRGLRLASDRVERAARLRSVQRRIASFSGQRDVTLESACRFWSQRDYGLLPDFVRSVESVFEATPALADFVNNAEGVRREINKWVEERTRRRIRELVPPGLLNSSTRLVLVNAVYFLGPWLQAFSPRDTQRAPFHDAMGVPSGEVELMYRELEFPAVRYAEADGAQICELAYRGADVAMLLVLPSPGQWGTLAPRLTGSALSGWRRALRPRTVQVYLPRFRIESEARLDAAFGRMGMGEAFDPNRADLSRMSGRRELYVSAVLHKAFVEVQEKGTEAAAATAVVVKAVAAPVEESPVVFRADRPFLFVILDRRTGATLFWGHVVRPPQPPER
ncbi:MAG: serpin family protein [Kiritimatiellae bacterium]|nr:serpin family protein [Kiritimatiellia bacterium]